jgi:hypothetical protein
LDAVYAVILFVNGVEKWREFWETESHHCKNSYPSDEPAFVHEELHLKKAILPFED